MVGNGYATLHAVRVSITPRAPGAPQATQPTLTASRGPPLHQRARHPSKESSEGAPRGVGSTVKSWDGMNCQTRGVCFGVSRVSRICYPSNISRCYIISRICSETPEISLTTHPWTPASSFLAQAEGEAVRGAVVGGILVHWSAKSFSEPRHAHCAAVRHCACGCQRFHLIGRCCNQRRWRCQARATSPLPSLVVGRCASSSHDRRQVNIRCQECADVRCTKSWKLTRSKPGGTSSWCEMRGIY